jgi:hypothetical protein
MRQSTSLGSRTDADVLAVVEARLRDGRSARQIHGELAADDSYKARSPSLRTVQRYAKQYVPPDPNEYWRLEDADPEEAAAFVPVLAELAMRGAGMRRRLTRTEARMIVRVRVVAPDLHPMAAFWVADRHLAAQQFGHDTGATALFLSFAPWRSAERRAAMVRTVDAGFLPQPVRDHLRDLLGYVDAALEDPTEALRAVTAWTERFPGPGDDSPNAGRDDGPDDGSGETDVGTQGR